MTEMYRPKSEEPRSEVIGLLRRALVFAVSHVIEKTYWRNNNCWICQQNFFVSLLSDFCFILVGTFLLAGILIPSGPKTYIRLLILFTILGFYTSRTGTVTSSMQIIDFILKTWPLLSALCISSLFRYSI
jgi:hypothetical protein